MSKEVIRVPNHEDPIKVLSKLQERHKARIFFGSDIIEQLQRIKTGVEFLRVDTKNVRILIIKWKDPEDAFPREKVFLRADNPSCYEVISNKQNKKLFQKRFFLQMEG